MHSKCQNTLLCISCCCTLTHVTLLECMQCSLRSQSLCHLPLSPSDDHLCSRRSKRQERATKGTRRAPGGRAPEGRALRAEEPRADPEGAQEAVQAELPAERRPEEEARREPPEREQRHEVRLRARREQEGQNEEEDVRPSVRTWICEANISRTSGTG